MNVGDGWEAASHKLFGRSHEAGGVPFVSSLVKWLLHYMAAVSVPHPVDWTPDRSFSGK